MTSLIDGMPVPPTTIPSPTTSADITPNPAYSQWFKRDQLLLSWILSSLSEEVYSYVISYTSSLSTWRALESAFGSVSHNRQLQIYVELQELKKNDMIVAQYLQKAKSLADELASAGRMLSSTKFNAIIYHNIDIEYHPIVSALNLCTEPVPLSPRDCHRRPPSLVVVAPSACVLLCTSTFLFRFWLLLSDFVLAASNCFFSSCAFSFCHARKMGWT